MPFDPARLTRARAYRRDRRAPSRSGGDARSVQRGSRRLTMSPAHVLEPTYQAIRKRLMEAAWPAGFRLDTARLAGELGVSTSPVRDRSEEHTSELQSLMRITYAGFCV